nr:hypothetical protein [Streptomyces actinomycinicus]
MVVLYAVPCGEAHDPRLDSSIACGADVFVGGDTRATADSAALAGGGQAFVGADDAEFADALSEGGEDVEDEPAAGDGGVQVPCSEVKAILRSRSWATMLMRSWRLRP